MKKLQLNVMLDDNTSTVWIGKNIFWDSGSFRPEMKLFLKNKKPYKATVYFDEENLQNGDIVTYPKKLSIDSENIGMFINIR